jgi:hypothetical protein
MAMAKEELLELNGKNPQQGGNHAQDSSGKHHDELRPTGAGLH